jgi:hypothetical protein
MSSAPPRFLPPPKDHLGEAEAMCKQFAAQTRGMRARVEARRR